jgi:hypothetical protein
MFYGYRSGKYPITDKVWRKLAAAQTRLHREKSDSQFATSSTYPNHFPELDLEKSSLRFREEPNHPPYRPPPSDFADLATHLVRRLPPDTAWQMVAELTAKARAGDHSAITAARALLSILETYPPDPPPPPEP